MSLGFRKSLEYSVLYKSLVGKYVKVIDSSNKNLIGLEGWLVKESANMFHILGNKGSIRKILKKSVVIEAEVEGKLLNMDGSLLFSTISNRIKKMK